MTKIGLLAPLSGEYKSLGESLLYSLQLALEEIDDKNVIIIPRDSGFKDKDKLESAIKEIKSLGANIIIHPRTIRKIGTENFEKIIQELRYGTISINGWSALGFLLSQCPWGAFPGHTLEDIQSGIGTVHNTLMLSKTQRSIIKAPWRPFPRGLLSGCLLYTSPSPRD